MKCLLTYIFFGLLTFSCAIKTTPEKIEYILGHDTYKVEINYSGCFGTGTEILRVNKNSDSSFATLSYLDYAESDGPFRKEKTIIWNEGKEDGLAKLFTIGSSLQDSISLCTSTISYKLIKFPYSVYFEDLNCEIPDSLNIIFQ